MLFLVVYLEETTLNWNVFGPADVYNGFEDDHGEADAQRFKAVTWKKRVIVNQMWSWSFDTVFLFFQMRKNKRLLSVHPLDFDPEDYFPHSRRPSVQVLYDNTENTWKLKKVNTWSQKTSEVHDFT